MSEAFESGTTLGNYRVEHLLGRGGVGAVFLAYDTTLHRRVALKVIDEGVDGENSRSQLLREARNAAALNHPNICTIHEIGQAGRTTFIAMEYVEGRSLRELIDDQGALPPDEVLRYGLQAAEALAYAHEHGVVHRDFKAANAMITSDRRLKIVDFGLARRSDLLMAGATTVGSLVPAGAVAGTPYAMAPEQVRGEVADARTDLWALGVLLYEMATGAKPFTGVTIPERFAAILTSPPSPLPATVSVGLGGVIDRCLEKDPAQRYANASEVRAALGAIETGNVPLSVAWRYHLRRRPALVLSAVFLAIVAAIVGPNIVGLRDRLLGGAGASERITLAVLPFKNLTGDPGQEYFSDGLTDEMITQLGRLHPEHLSVIARSSAMQYKNNPAASDVIGRELGVDYVLEGTALRDGNRVRINATLVQVRDRMPLWSERYESELAGILVLQNDVARGIARALALTLLPAEEARLAGARQVNPQAYEAYLLGQSHARRLTRPELDRAQEYYEAAINIDPQFALAYYGIGRVWAGRVQTGLVTKAEEAGRGNAALMQAIALDDTLPEVHMALANDQTWAQWQWTEAERSFRRALDLNPNLAEAHSFYSHYLYIVGRPREGAAEIQRALELDPLNDLIQQFYGMTLRFEGRPEEGVAHAQQVLQTNPNSPSAWNALADNFYQLGRYEDSMAAQLKSLGTRGTTVIADAMTRGYAEGGFRGAMRRAADARAARGDAWPAAQLYIRAEQPDLALDWLERALEARNPNLPYIALLPVFNGVRGEARFKALLQGMNLAN